MCNDGWTLTNSGDKAFCKGIWDCSHLLILFARRLVGFSHRGGSRGRVQAVRTPPEMTCGFLVQLVFCKKKLCGLLVLKKIKRRVHPLLKKILDPPQSHLAHLYAQPVMTSYRFSARSSARRSYWPGPYPPDNQLSSGIIVVLEKPLDRS